MSSEQDHRPAEQTDAAYESSGDKQKIDDLFENQLKLFSFMPLTRVIVLGTPSPIQFPFLKHLVQLLKKEHQIKDVFIQGGKERNSPTWDVESQGFTMMYDTDKGPTIGSKVSTSSLVIAPSVPQAEVHQAFGRSGPGLLICRDINRILAEEPRPNGQYEPGGLLEWFSRFRNGGYKIKMPLLKGGESWCEETRIHRSKIANETQDFEETIGLEQGWTFMGGGRLRTLQWVCS